MEELDRKTKLFIKRERIRRAFIKTKVGETICLNHEETQLLLKWIKELEERIEEYGNEKGKKANSTGKAYSVGGRSR